MPRSKYIFPYSASFDVSGQYYSKQKRQHRVQLEIKSKDSSQLHPDLMVIMMNPGGSKPINANYKKNNLVAAVADKTQEKIVEFMIAKKLSYVRVLNLSDICEKKSGIFYNSISKKEAQNTHSIFHPKRRVELETLFRKNVPALIAWGVSTKLDPLIDNAFNYIIENSSVYFGVNKPDFSNKYYHPLIRRSKKEITWVQQCLNNF